MARINNIFVMMIGACFLISWSNLSGGGVSGGSVTRDTWYAGSKPVSDYDKEALADLEKAAEAQERYFVENEVYATCDSAKDCVAKLPGLDAVSEGTVLSMKAVGEDKMQCVGSAYHEKGSQKHQWDSDVGIEESVPLKNR